MRCGRLRLLLPMLAGLTCAACRSTDPCADPSGIEHYKSVVQQVTYPDVPVGADVLADEGTSVAPPTVRRFEDVQYENLTLEDAIRLAVDNNETIRQVGGAVVRSTAQTSTVYDPAIVETDPRFGVDSALSAYDAQFNAGFSSWYRDRQLNLFNPQLQYRQENLGGLNFGFSKIAATGTQLRLDQATGYTRLENGQGEMWPFSRVPSVFETLVTASARHPLLQGGGVEFNRIAGPNGVPGQYRGVLIARLNTDVALVDFQLSVRNLLRDVERGYWELYFAYRDLDAKITGRRNALESWELEKRRVDAKLRPADQEAYAREQYYAAQASVENAISGSRGQPGVFGAERELRSLLGLPANDGKLLRPSTPPLTTDIQFEWRESLELSLERREELRRQRWKVKQRELERIAASNYALPQLNAIGQYHWRGFGDDLLGQSDASLNSLFKGDLQGWMLGVEFESPIGRRQGFAAVRNAELLWRRETALLLEQERQIALELRAAFTELDRAYVVTRSSYNRHIAAQTQLEAEQKRNAVGDTRLDLVLDAQRRAVLAEIEFHRAIVDYNQALSHVNLVRGTLLESLNVQLAEGPWSEEAHTSAAVQRMRYVPKQHGPREVAPPPMDLGEIPPHHAVDPKEIPAVPSPATASSTDLPNP